LRINQRARFGQVFWCDFPTNAPDEEFHAEHPAVVVRSAKDLKDTCIIVPITSQPHAPGPTVHKLRRNYNPAAPSLSVWAVCSHLYTVSQSRLRPFQHGGHQIVPKMAKDDLADIIACVRSALPQIFPPVPLSAEGSTLANPPPKA
jgi:mRNA interferase MazF